MKRLLTGVVIITLFCMLLPVSGQSAPDDIVVVGSADTPENLTSEEVKQIFLGKKTRWADDSTLTFVILNEKDIYTAFLQQYLGKTYSQYRNYWKKQVFTGKGRMPKAFDSTDDMFAYLAENEGVISFVKAAEVDPENVKIIIIE